MKQNWEKEIVDVIRNNSHWKKDLKNYIHFILRSHRATLLEEIRALLPTRQDPINKEEILEKIDTVLTRLTRMEGK